ncbi:Uma2 family endonuclease [Phormidium sp. FACHB-1136]|uniref:Uma2 family endonuclease n=1 Tax=Phormidium sp. FACHB-1136 TaxID=2692848 RepID=UPI001687F56D|nr:Uma2 family endonuclease [Phormidium sp. FACHB-1136]MBD2428482.1 Uma2 family endonuclease [Phormidium sp. FACHB-1136]
MVTIQLRQLEVPPGQRLVLRDVSWAEFNAILAELGGQRSTRIAYDHGLLEIMAPLPEHEYFKETMGDAVKDISEELDLDYESYGSTTWRKQAAQAGIEPDNCFYVQNEALVRGKLTLDLDQDPPPDLALEIDLTSKSIHRFSIYARLGIPEIWCYDQGQLTVYRLQSGAYQSVAQSLVFPMLKVQELPSLIEAHRTQGRLALRRAVRAWVRDQIQ